MDIKVKKATGRALMVLALSVAFIVGCSRNPANVFQGYIEANMLYVASPLGGALTNLAVARGDSVTNGQSLFELERGSEADALNAAKKNLAAKASLALSEITLARQKELRANNGVISARNWIRRARSTTPTPHSVNHCKPRSKTQNGRLIRSSNSRRRMRLCRTRCIGRANGLRREIRLLFCCRRKI